MASLPLSPRLPSPPPLTEIQIGPESPSLERSHGGSDATVEQSTIDARINSSRRVHPGTKAQDMAAGPPLVPLGELDSAFQLQEHLKALHYYHTKPPNDDHTVPINRETALLIATLPDGIDQTLWLYEICRFIINKCNDLIIGFLFDDPPCSAHTCPEMRASEWQFLCAVHEQPKSCCAIDYCCHTLDWATNIVTSQKIFPSRLSLGAGDSIADRGAGVKHLINIFRRLHRIFAHAWFQHRGVFWQVEGQTGLYVMFKTVCDMNELLPAENYKLPPEAEGLETPEEVKPAVPTIMKSDSLSAMIQEDFTSPRRTITVRQHTRSSPSVGSAITTLIEADEDETDSAQRLDGALSHAATPHSDIPVIVKTYEVDENDEEEEPHNKDTVVSEDAPSPATREEVTEEQLRVELRENPDQFVPEPSSDDLPAVDHDTETAVEPSVLEAAIEDPTSDQLQETESRERESVSAQENSTKEIMEEPLVDLPSYEREALGSLKTEDRRKGAEPVSEAAEEDTQATQAADSEAAGVTLKQADDENTDA